MARSQRLHIIIQTGSPVVRQEADLVVEARVVDKGLDDVEHDLGVHPVLLREATMKAFGTDADRVADTVSKFLIGFTVHASRDDVAMRYDVERIEALLSGGEIPIQDPVRRLIARIKADVAADGQATIYDDEMQTFLAMIGEKA